MGQTCIGMFSWCLCSFVLHLSFFWCLGRDVFHYCCISWVVSLIVLQTYIEYSDKTARMRGLIRVFRRLCPIMKTCLYNFDPLKPHFYTVKLGFTGVYIIFLISAQNIDCGYSLELPRGGSSNEYPQSMFWAEIWKISQFFLSENFKFLEEKFSIYLNRRVFVML